MLRNLFKSDLRKLLAIEESVHIAPWTEDTFLTCFNAGYFGWVIEVDNEIAGFIIVSLRELDCHVLNLCVSQQYQHQGYGRTMLTHALRYAKQKGAGIAYLEVRKSNKIAISLYRKMKFHLVGERKAYYPSSEGDEDALVFAMSLHEEINTG